MLPLNSNNLLEKSVAENLFVKLIEQLNKDFALSNLDSNFNIEISPNELIKKLDFTLTDLITNNYDGYLNLLYRIDVSEKELIKIKSNTLIETIEQISFVILKREFQKVWFKNKL